MIQTLFEKILSFSLFVAVVIIVDLLYYGLLREPVVEQVSKILSILAKNNQYIYKCADAGSVKMKATPISSVIREVAALFYTIQFLIYALL